MDDYLITFREMISLRGLTDHISDRAMNAGISQLRFYGLCPAQALGFHATPHAQV